MCDLRMELNSVDGLGGMSDRSIRSGSGGSENLKIIGQALYAVTMRHPDLFKGVI